jgi:hypothetical protein
VFSKKPQLQNACRRAQQDQKQNAARLQFPCCLFQRPVAGLFRCSVTKSTGPTTMGNPMTMVSNCFFIFGDVVGSNVLNHQSLEGQVRIGSSGRDTRTAMVMTIGSKLSFRKFRVRHGRRRSFPKQTWASAEPSNKGCSRCASPPWMRGSKGLRAFSGRTGATKSFSLQQRSSLGSQQQGCAITASNEGS